MSLYLTIGKLTYKIAPVRDIVAIAKRDKKLSTYMLAKLSGVSHQTISNFLDGTHEMRTDKLQRLMAVLGLELKPKK